jgi:hypothetical protein
MVIISVAADCGNSPKRRFLKDFNIAYAEGNFDFLLDSVSDDINLDTVGDRQIQSKAEFAQVLAGTRENPPTELILASIIIHGKEGAANGTIKTQDGREFAFCDFYEFKSAKGDKIKSITSYVIELIS